MKTLSKLILLILLSASFMACEKSSDGPSNESLGSDKGPVIGNGDAVDNALHMAFKTPDWERKIDCTHLDLDPIGLNDSTSYVSSTSASTNETFYFSFPRDSSVMVRSSNIKKYEITRVGGNKKPFEFSQTLPIIANSTTKLVSLAGSSSDSYNEVLEIKYIGVKGNYIQFQIKCRYSMSMGETLNESNKRLVTGTFHFKVKTKRI